MADGQVVFEISGDNRKLNDVLRDTTGDIEKESKKWDNAVEKSADNIEKSVEKMAKDVATEAKNSSDKIKDSFSKASKSVSDDMEKAADDSAANFTKAMARALDINRLKDWGLKAGKMLLDFGEESVQAASDLQEVQNVVDVTFGESAGQIEKWAKSAGQQFGLTETQAKKFTSTLGAMMKSAGLAGPEIVNMSTDLAGLAADMASFYNLDFDTAFQKIRSGISGETEPLTLAA